MDDHSNDAEGVVMTPGDGWTSDTVLTHVKALLDASDKHTEQQFKDLRITVLAAQAAANDAAAESKRVAEVATEKTEVALKEYKTASNEWRTLVEGVFNKLPTRLELDVQFKAIDEKIEVLTAKKDQVEGKSIGRHDLWAYAVGTGGALIGVLALLYEILK